MKWFEMVLLLVLSAGVIFLSHERRFLRDENTELKQQLEEADASADIALKGLVAAKKTTLPAPVQVFELPDGNYDWMSWCDIVVRDGSSQVVTVTHGLDLPVRFSVKKGVVSKRSD